MQEFTLPYGRGEVSFAFADDVPVNVITGRAPEADGSPKELVQKALAEPVGAPLLWEILNDTDKIVVAVPDITRKANAAVVIPEILYALTKYAGVPVSHITLLFTCGLHRAMTDKEHRYIVGNDAVESGIIIKDHTRVSETVKVGTSSAGHPIELSKIAVEADRVILTGETLSHHFAGYSGGRKSVLPGLASQETIRRNHALTINPGKGLEPNCWMGILDGNPVHENMMEAARLLNPDYLVTVVPSAHGGLAGAVAGHWEYAWLKAIEICNEYTFAPIDKPMELAVTSSGGYPKDINFVQFHKAINNSCRSMRDGGALINLVEGEDGWGNPKLRDWCLKGDIAWLATHGPDTFETNMNSAGRFLENVNRFNVILVTALPSVDIKAMGAHHASTIDEAFELAYKLLDTRTPETTVITNGNIIVPQII